jgi:chromosome segregation ATPase
MSEALQLSTALGLLEKNILELESTKNRLRKSNDLVNHLNIMRRTCNAKHVAEIEELTKNAAWETTQLSDKYVTGRIRIEQLERDLERANTELRTHEVWIKNLEGTVEKSKQEEARLRNKYVDSNILVKKLTLDVEYANEKIHLRDTTIVEIRKQSLQSHDTIKELQATIAGLEHAAMLRNIEVEEQRLALEYRMELIKGHR